MAEVTTSAPKSAPKKATKPKAPAAHPKYIEMAVAALNALKERGGSSRQAIIKYILSNYKVGNDQKVVGTHLKLALKRGVDSGMIKHVKGSGASGSFKANPEAKKKKEKKPKAPKKAKASKPKKAKTASPKKAKSASPKKAKSAAPKKAKAAAPKKAKAAAPKKAKSPKKPAAKKSPAKKTSK